MAMLIKSKQSMALRKIYVCFKFLFILLSDQHMTLQKSNDIYTSFNDNLKYCNGQLKEIYKNFITQKLFL